jgi:hypothetical protein
MILTGVPPRGSLKGGRWESKWQRASDRRACPPALATAERQVSSGVRDPNRAAAGRGFLGSEGNAAEHGSGGRGREPMHVFGGKQARRATEP